MYDLKSTETESVGKGHTYLRSLLQVTWVGACVLVVWAPLAAFITLALSSIGLSYLTGRVFVIKSLYRIRTIVNHRERLLTFMDNEYVLQQVKQDQIWRGEPVSPDVESRLAEYARLRATLHESLTKAVSDLFRSTETKQETN